MLIDLLPLMIGAAAIIHCFFLIAVLLRLSGKLDNRLLASTLLFLAIRMGACIGGLIYADFELTGLYLGAIAFAMTGPSFYFYLHSLWDPSFRLHSRHAYHLALAILTLAALPILNVHIAFGLYLSALLAMIVYVILGFTRFRKADASNRLDNMRWRWTLYFNAGIAVLLILFLAQSFFFDAFIYQGIIIASALVLYMLTLVAVKQAKLFMYEPRRTDKQQQIEELGKKIEDLLTKEEIFTNPLMSVSLLAKQLMVPSYLVSLAVNAYFRKSFPEMINTLRIQKAEQLLTDPAKSHFTIEAIAYESGFSALSVFYTAFKKAHRKTPKKFRMHSLNSDTKGVSAENN